MRFLLYRYCLVLLIITLTISKGLALSAEEKPVDENAVVLVCHPDNPINSLSKTELRAIYSMHLQEWKSGRSIKVYVLPDRSEIHQRFTKNNLGFFAYQLRRNWDRQVFSGTGEAPKEIATALQMKAQIATTKDSIGYLPVKLIDKSVKVLEVK